MAKVPNRRSAVTSARIMDDARRRAADPEAAKALNRYLDEHYPNLDRPSALSTFREDQWSKNAQAAKGWRALKKLLRVQYPRLDNDDALGTFCDEHKLVRKDLAGLAAIASRVNRNNLDTGTPNAWVRLRIDGNTLLLDGKPVHLGLTPEGADQALVFLRELIKEPGNWKSGPDIGKATDNEGVRFGRVLKRLPDTVKSLIETDRRKGHRLKPPGPNSE